MSVDLLALKQRLAMADKKVPIADAQEAVRILRARTDHWPGCDKYPRAEAVPMGYTKSELKALWDARKCTCGLDEIDAALKPLMEE